VSCRRAILTSDTDPIEVWLVSTKNQQANAVQQEADASAQSPGSAGVAQKGSSAQQQPGPLSPACLFRPGEGINTAAGLACPSHARLIIPCPFTFTQSAIRWCPEQAEHAVYSVRGHRGHQRVSCTLLDSVWMLQAWHLIVSPGATQGHR
jgi:hypothetical protein